MKLAKMDLEFKVFKNLLDILQCNRMKPPKKHQGPAALARVGVTADGTVPPALSVSSGFQLITLTTSQPAPRVRGG